ncbi:hypothetical protein INS49_010415 [Diaporthe citri]|uniref:uncharacterized protein n=1 Tax=Diaporthe citri TaxID=83186 RepID=UPI001C7F0268|nr:uncharacterized protein INS49_010415 [Diaporthe citri]KAG6362185.1 hypothetical protein INS49_010415 [Diaporthe citri]
MSDEDQKLMQQISLLAGKSLVLNNAHAPNSSNHVAGTASDETASSSWVTRNDRHLQLINSSVFHEQAEARTKAMQQTRLQKQQQKEHRERAKLMNHLKHTANPSVASANPASALSYEISVEGIRFRVANNGSKLVKIPGAPQPSLFCARLPAHQSMSGDPNGPKATPKMALVGGVKFHRSKNGNMYRQAIVKAHRQSAAIKKTNVTCKNFSNTGSCPKGPMCRYIHDPSRVAACKDLLLKGTCSAGDQCDLSHDLVPERTPHCAPVCHSFGFYGYCDKGISCPDRHVFECPDFSNTGVCKTKGCKLPHRERASVLRKANAALEQNENRDDEDDLSSDDDNNSVSSDDVDSDEVEEFVGEEDPTDFEKDFISFN